MDNSVNTTVGSKNINDWNLAVADGLKKTSRISHRLHPTHVMLTRTAEVFIVRPNRDF